MMPRSLSDGAGAYPTYIISDIPSVIIVALNGIRRSNKPKASSDVTASRVLSDVTAPWMSFVVDVMGVGFV